jgi:VIT1/CCC1 family predicted Fe2+/Mn2+ transporter
MPRHSPESHRSSRTGWLRAAVMGANDGIVSTASLVMGVAGSGADQDAILLAGLAGLVAGAMSMAAGEYVSVSSQADTEQADLARERHELTHQDEHERAELAAIYESRGLTPDLAREVADQLMAHDALGAHARDELGIVESQRARPVQAALASASTFAVGAAVPLLSVWPTDTARIPAVVTVVSLLVLALMGAAAARVGGASPLRGAGRVVFWGGFAMALTWAAGHLFGAVI